MDQSMVTKSSALGTVRRGPTIACMDHSTVDAGVDFKSLIRALQEYVDKSVAPAWATPAELVVTTGPKEGCWSLLLLDNADQAERLHTDFRKEFGPEAKSIVAYHDYKGFPVAMVFAQTALNSKSSLDDRHKLSLAASHELAEMLVDPGNNLWCETGKNTYFAYEVCDPVEHQHFFVRKLAMSNFVYPAYYEPYRKTGSAQFDHMGNVKKPFQILPGGYAPVKKNGRLVLQAPKKKQKELEQEDRRLHRSEFRRAALPTGVKARKKK
jgi:hypothetical protein